MILCISRQVFQNSGFIVLGEIAVKCSDMTKTMEVARRNKEWKHLSHPPFSMSRPPPPLLESHLGLHPSQLCNNIKNKIKTF